MGNSMGTSVPLGLVFNLHYAYLTPTSKRTKSISNVFLCMPPKRTNTTPTKILKWERKMLMHQSSRLLKRSVNSNFNKNLRNHNARANASENIYHYMIFKRMMMKKQWFVMDDKKDGAMVRGSSSPDIQSYI
ncbi:hypothetical protein VNO77_36306 [Canavalia gladiata]|uniref:Uncharacterized protein n=1 Tax=Canavalia gladiata TaxID=3824 RepID=A0AAN9K953_CANGL